MVNSTPQVVTIAGSDSGGGAGIQADLKTFQARHAFGMSIIVALTAQNTYGVQDSLAIPPSLLRRSLLPSPPIFTSAPARQGCLLILNA